LTSYNRPERGTPMELETERLIIKLLTLSQLKLWVNNISTLEVELNCKCDKEPIDGFFLDIVNNQIKIIENDPENYVYHSFWFIIRKEDNRAVGSMDYKNIPNGMNEVEIGYGLEKQFEHNGYMTEAVGEFCKMVFTDEKIETIIAETEVENIASYKVLERCGFEKYKEEETYWWRLNKYINRKASLLGNKVL
jgi:RimJ/RimL family protein N-acetyltransferase